MYRIGYIIGRLKAKYLTGYKAGLASLIFDSRLDEVRTLVLANPKDNYIPAIKLHRSYFNSMLKEAKDAVDTMLANAGIERGSLY
jgi:ribosomal protein L7/L12